MDSLRQQSPTTGNPRTEATSLHHGVTAMRFRLAPSAQRIDVQDGANETIRGWVLRLEMWLAGILQQDSKPRFALRRAAKSDQAQLAESTFRQTSRGNRFRTIRNCQAG